MAHDVERVLADIDADHDDRGIACLRHGVLLVFGAPGQLQSLAGHRSTAGPSHSDVPSQAHSARFPIPTRTHREVLAPMDRAEEKAEPKDVGEQALMRGLDTAFPFFRLGLSWSSVGRRSDDRPHNGFQDFPCRDPTFTSARLMSATAPLILIATKGAVGRSSASHDSSGPQRPTTLRLSRWQELAIDRPNEGG